MHRTQLASVGWLLAAVLIAGTGAPLRAQGADDQQHGVARISVMDGQVSVRRGDADWVAGIINAPLLADDRISTGPNSRAEIEFNSANLVRLGGTAEIRIAALDANQLQLELSHGTITYRVLRPSTTNAEVDTPNISVRPSKVGTYRISVTAAGQTELIVRAGDVEVFSPRGSQWVNAGQMMIARGSTADPEFQIVAPPAPDAWDAWSDNRDRILMQSRSAQRVPQGVYGSEDLDNYGDWVNTPDYGYVWQPQVAPGWAPYQMGQWEWLELVWLDLGQRRSLGLGPVPLWPLVLENRLRLALVSGRVRHAALLVAGPGRLFRFQVASASVLALTSATSAGCRWRRMKSCIHGGAGVSTAPPAISIIS